MELIQTLNKGLELRDRSNQLLQQQISELQQQLQAYKAGELRDTEYSRLVTDLQEKLQKTEDLF